MAQIQGSGLGNWANTAQVTNNQELKVLPSNSDLEIARGNFNGIGFIHKFGRNPDIDGDFETVWNGGDDYTGHNATEPEIIEIFSSSTADVSGTGVGAHTLTLPRLLDGNYALMDDVQFELNGTTSIYSTGSYLRCSRAIVNTAGASGVNIGTITIRQSGTTANVFAVMPIGYNQTMIAADTVQSGVTAHLTAWYASITSRVAGFNNMRLLMRPSGGVFNVKEEFAIATAGNSYVQRNYGVPKNSLKEKTDIKVMADASANNMGVSAGFDLITVDNSL